MSISLEDVARVATLARIKVNPDELSHLGAELSGILHWIEKLNEIDITGVQNYCDRDSNSMPEREDEVTDGDRVPEILANAPESAHDMFAVPKVVE